MGNHIFTGFGFGPIQAGLFLSEAFKNGNFSRIVVAEIDQNLVDAIRANNGSYYVNVATSKSVEVQKIDGVEIYNPAVEQDKIKLLEAIITACVDHGVTPPSAQATLILASTRANYEVAISAGIQAITDVHGGAGQKAAEFMLTVVNQAKETTTDLIETTFELIKETIKSGKRIEGLGHRIHTQDPRRDVLWTLAEKAGYAKECVSVSKVISDAFYRVRGMNLPINVDGVIGAIIADMEINPKLAKAVFVFGRTAGLAAHYYEEINTQPQMRRIAFDKAVYKGPSIRELKE